MLKYWKIAFTFIGTVIGAGFASGKEVAVFFGDGGIFAPIFSALLLGALAFLFLEVGRLSHGNPAAFLFPRAPQVMKIFLKVTNLAMLAAMIAGAELILQTTFSFSGGGLLSGLLALAIVIGGAERIKNVNFFAVPLIVLLVVVLYALSPRITVGGRLLFSSSLLYAALNIVSGGALIAEFSANTSRRGNLFSALIIFVVIAALLLLIRFAVIGSEGEEMPLLSLATRFGIGFTGGILIYLSVMTTMIGCLTLSSGKTTTSALGALAAAFTLGMAGFGVLVDKLYPALGAAGIAMSIAAFYRVVCHDNESCALMCARH